MKSIQHQGYLLVALSALILGSLGIFARWVNLPSPVLLFYRYFLGALILLFYFLAKKKKISFPKTQKKEVFIIGTINTLLSVSAFYAFTNTSIAIAEILLYSYPIYVVLLAPLILKEKIEKSTISYVFISFIGLILIATSATQTQLNQNFLGIFAGFSAGVIFAVYVIFAKIMRSRFGGLELNLYQMVISVFLLFPFLFIFRYQIDFYKIILLITMGIFHSALALSLYFTGIKIVKAQHVGIISYFEPLSAVAYAFIFLAEVPTVYTIIGGALILYSGYKILRKQT